MASTSNTVPLVVARFLIACPFLVRGVTTFSLLTRGGDSSILNAQVSPLVRMLGDLGAQLPQEKLVILMAVMQGLGGFLLVFNHKFGGLLLMAYLIPTTLASHQFWREGMSDTQVQFDMLTALLKDVAILGGILAFMTTTDEVPLKVKRKPHID